MGKLIDLKGQNFGFWIVLESAGKNKTGQTIWLCQCDCGNKKTVTTNSLRTGNSTSCGCNNTPNLTNKKFGELLVLHQDETKDKGRRYWLCQCSCGKILSANTNQLRNDKIISCGCKNTKSEVIYNEKNIDNLEYNDIHEKDLSNKVSYLIRLLEQCSEIIADKNL